MTDCDRRPLRRVPGPRRSGFMLLRLFVLLILAAAAFAAYALNAYQSPGPLAAEKTFTVQRGMNVLEIGARLEAEGIITQRHIFALGAWTTGASRRIKAGEYLAPPGASMASLTGLMVAGKALSYKLTIPEGWTSQMAAERINADANLSGPPIEPPEEGSLLPDTYSFPKGYSRQELLQEMMLAQTKLIDSLWTKRVPDLPLATPREALILASIVEKETGVPKERALVAGVFINRLRQQMRLQSDPTVIYGIVGGVGRLDRPISKADLRAETPYNTYRIKALPPGPIANPGRDALAAVLNPAQTDALYFVADGTGGHVFAATLGDHNANVKEWRALQKRLTEESEDGDEAAEAETAAPEQATTVLPRPRPKTK